MEKLLIVDGNSILNRAYYGIRPLSAPDGTPTNAVYGFLNILFKYLEEETPDYLCVAFDVKAKTFRHKMYNLYKAQRKPAPEDFVIQLPVIKEVLRAMNCACVEKEGYEADDLIGTISRCCEEKRIACCILTGDKDDLQLASPLTTVKLVVTRMGNTTTTDYNHEDVLEKYGVTPQEYIDVKGLMGDPSDNIPGVKGVGEKTAFSLIQKYKSMDAIYADINQLDITNAVRNKLINGKESAYLSRTLATIDRFVPIEFEFSDFSMGSYNDTLLYPLLKKLNFKSFIQKLGIESADEEQRSVNFTTIMENIREEDLETFMKEWEYVIYYIAWDENLFSLLITGDGEHIGRVENASDQCLRTFFESSVPKIGYNCKQDYLHLKGKNIELAHLKFDVMIAAYILDPTRSEYGLESLCLDYLGIQLTRGEKVEEGGQISMMLDSDPVQTKEKFGLRLWGLFELFKLFQKKIEENQQKDLYYQIELPLVEVLADMEWYGVYVDKEALKAFGTQLKSRIDILTHEIYSLAGEEFNIQSPKQLGNILFDKLKLPSAKKTKTGYSTNVDVLQKLVPDYEIAGKILEYRQLTKLQSTYVEGLLAMINTKTGRIHSNFNQTVTATGRISSTEPNLQNIPVRTELGREIRRMFVAQGEDRYFVDADYSQIELRVLAHISDDDTMKQAFTDHMDIHTQTASQVFGVPLKDVTPTMRFRAKAVNFGIVYGIGAFSLAQDLKISRKEADEYIKGYLHHYPQVAQYMERTVKEAREKGYISTLVGRRRYMPELKASNRNTQAFGERVAMNAPIQGSAADIIKIAMVHVHQRLKNEGLLSRLILQVHDELIVEAVKEELEQVKQILQEEMEQAYMLSVPLEVDLNIGRSWYDTK